VTLLAAALNLTAHGLAVIPTHTDGTKRPGLPKWRHYIENGTPPTTDEVVAWFKTPGTTDGLGLITGTPSGQLEMLEVEGRAIHLLDQLATLLIDHDLKDLGHRLNQGWTEESPSGGIHWMYRVDGPARRNTKLASRPGPPDEKTGKPTVEVLIETRGEGGFVVTAPSAGRTHPTGRAWTILRGGPHTIPTITIEERDALYAIATMLDEMPTPEPASYTASSTPGGTAGQRPGDDFNTRATWDDILTGWTKTRRLGNGYAWTRPGKKPRDGISATTNQSRDDVDRLYVFSSSTDFEPERPYDKFGAYALLNHGGDIPAAAKQLAKDGYGTPPPEPTRLPQTSPSATDTTKADDPPGNSGTPTVVAEGDPHTYTRTDDGNALRLVDTHHQKIRYCPQRGQWLRWNASRWEWDEAEYIQELARQTARNLPHQSSPDRTHRSKSLSSRGVASMIRLARSDERATVHLSKLDARPFELNTPNGIVNLATGKLHDPDPSALHTRSTTVAPDPGPAPRWEKFLADTFAGDPALTTYVQRLVGVSLIGTVLEQLLPFPFGSGANGKTTLLGVVQRLVGIGDTGYAISAPADMLLATQNAGHPTEIARLSGARLVVTSELEDNQRFAEAKVKQLTGRDVIAGRFMRQDWFSFHPTHTLWLLANHQPEVRAGGPAFWRRIALLPFLHTVPPADRDPHLEDRLVDEEGPQILHWLITGAVDYLTDGLARPASVDVATDAYARDQDTVARFVEECCDLGTPGAQTYAVASAKLRTEYETWCRQEGETPIPAKTLTLQLRSRFDVQSERTMHARMLSGIRLKPELDNDGHASWEPPDDSPSARDFLPGSP
jgi:putative DNA primase/helicase